MRIAIWNNLPSGGGKRALYDHVRGLISRGHYVESWCPASADTSFLPLKNLCAEHVLPWIERSSAPWLLTSCRSNSLALKRKLRLMDDHCRQVGDAINAGEFDILFANSCQFFRSVPIGQYVSIPKLLYLQEPYRWLYEAMPEPPFMAPSRPGRSRFAPWYVRYRLRDFFDTSAQRLQIRSEYESARLFDRILVNSHFSRESVLRAYGLDASVCYLGVDITSFSRKLAPRGDFVLGLGALVPEKNAEFVIRAISTVQPSPPRLVWVGNVQSTDHVRSLTALANQQGVIFEPRVALAHSEVVSLLSTATTLVYAPRLEPFGYAPLEANACGTPVVAVAEGGVRETVQDGVNGLVVTAQPEAMGQAIRRLREDPELVRRLGTQGLQMVSSKWSMEDAVARLENNLYDVVRLNNREIAR